MTGSLLDVNAPPLLPPKDADPELYAEEVSRYRLLRRASTRIAWFILCEIRSNHRMRLAPKFSADVQTRLAAQCSLLGATFDVGDNTGRINTQLNRTLKTFGLVTYDYRRNSATPGWPMVILPDGFVSEDLEEFIDRAFRAQWPDPPLSL